MPDPKSIQLQRHEDGTPSALRKTTFYQNFHFYLKSDVLMQLTYNFCERFLPRYGDRTVDQMRQAARSIKQNIAEGLTDGQTSFEVELRLLGIARGSNQELLEDYQDYIKFHGIPEWAVSNTTRYNKLREFCKAHDDNNSYQNYYKVWTDEEMANTAICLCHMVDKALSSFIAKKDREFVEQGGIRERMTAARLDCRATQKQIIENQSHEIERLKAQIASLQREIATLKGSPGSPR